MNIQHDTLANYTYAYVPGAASSKRVLVMLHGTGGNEDDLLGIGALLDANAHLLSPRGNVLENGMPRFFRRFGEGKFDTEDVIRRSQELADFLHEAIARYNLEGLEIVVVGYSNGANIASAVLALHPGIIDKAILLRPMLTLVPEKITPSPSTAVLILSGTSDPIVQRESVTELAEQLTRSAVKVTHIWEEAGHQLTQQDVNHMKEWLSN